MPVKRKTADSADSVAKRPRSDATAPVLDLLSPVSALSAMSDDSVVTDTDMSDARSSPPSNSVLFQAVPAVVPDQRELNASSTETTTITEPVVRTSAVAGTVAPADTMSSALAAELFGDEDHVDTSADAVAESTLLTGGAPVPAPAISAVEPASQPGVKSTATYRASEAAAVRLLAELGVEPGALVNADLGTLSALLDTLTKSAEVVSLPTPVETPVTAAAQSAAVLTAPALIDPTTSRSDRHRTGNDMASASAEAIQDALLDLDEVYVSSNRVTDWSVPEMKRVVKIERWADRSRNIYALNEGPQSKDWGKPAPFNDTSNILCIADTSIPITFWVIGELAAQWWFDAEGLPAARPALSIQPMGSRTAELSKDMLNEYCMPPGSSKVADQFGPDQVKASRWMNTRATKGQPAKTHEFRAVYDARKTLKDKSLLPQLNVGQLKIHDIVVMEVNVGRYAVKEDGAGDSKGKRRVMERWQSFYDLQAVYKIKDATNAFSTAAAVADFEV